MDVISPRTQLGVLTTGDHAHDSLLGLRATIDLAPIGLAQFDGAGRFLLVNDRLCDILGLTRDDVLARTFQEIASPDDLTHCLELTDQLAANEIPNYLIEKRFIRPDGSVVWARLTVSAVRRPDATVAFFIAVAEDITQQVDTAQAVTTTEERLRTAIGVSAIGTFRFDLRRNALDWADGLERVFGAGANTTLEQFFEVMHPDDREQVMASYTKSVTEGVDFEEEFRARWPDGTTHWLHDRGRTVLGEDGRPHYIVGAITDITNHKRMAEVISQRDAQFLTLANTIPQMAWSANNDGSRSWYNDRWLDYTGCSLEEMQGFGWMRMHESEDVARAVLTAQRTAFAAGSIWEDTIRLRGRNGEYRWFLSRAMPVRGADGTITQWFGTNTDITDRLDAEHQLRERENRYRKALDVENIGVIFFDNRHHVTGINNAFARMSGYTLAELTDGAFRWQDLAADARGIADVGADDFDLTGRTAPWELELRHKDGTRWWGLITATRVSEAEGVHFVLDVTVRKNAEREREDVLRREQAARNQAEHATMVRQQVLGFVAHDLRNPLTAIAGSASALLELPLSTEQRINRIEVIKRCAGDMDRLIADLLDVTRIEVGTFHVRREQVEVPRLVSEVVEGLQEQARSQKVQLLSEIEGDAPLLEGDRQRLAQALSNLVINAIKFTPAGGRVLIGARQEPSHLDIVVEDTGCGIAPENLPSIFNRFWQANRTSGGAGLGLAIVKGIVESHHGQIHVESALNRGTTFRVRLPRYRGALSGS